MGSALNVFKDGLPISDPTKTHDTEVTLFLISGKLAQNGCHGDFSSVWEPL